MFEGIELDKIDISANPPAEEPVRQYYFMAKCRRWVMDFEYKNGRLPKACVTTFGCQMNTEHEIEKSRINAAFFVGVEI